MVVVGRVGGRQVPLGLSERLPGGQCDGEHQPDHQRFFMDLARPLVVAYDGSGPLSRARHSGKTEFGTTAPISGKYVMITAAMLSRMKNGKAARATVQLSLPLHVLEHKDLQARWRDLGHLDVDDEIDAEPDEIEVGLLDHRQHDHRREHDHRDAVDQAAEDDVHDRQGDDELVAREVETLHPLASAFGMPV